MDVLRLPRAGRRSVIRVVLIALILLPNARLAAACDDEGDAAPEASVKAAFLYNFVKFADWSLGAGAPILMCVVGDDRIAQALVETVRGETINGHALKVEQPQESAGWRGCQLLFIADAEMRRTPDSLDSLKAAPILTVSDGPGFSAATGIIELFVERGRMRFAVNVDAAEHAGVRLSSRLLGLARVVRSVHAP